MKDEDDFETISISVDDSYTTGGEADGESGIYLDDVETITLDLSNASFTTIGEIEETGETRPNHYSQKEGSVECIAVIEQLCDEHQNDPFTDYNRYQAFKYLWRLGKKDDVLYDLRKAKTFIDFAIDRLERVRGEK